MECSRFNSCREISAVFLFLPKLHFLFAFLVSVPFELPNSLHLSLKRFVFCFTDASCISMDDNDCSSHDFCEPPGAEQPCVCVSSFSRAGQSCSGMCAVLYNLGGFANRISVRFRKGPRQILAGPGWSTSEEVEPTLWFCKPKILFGSVRSITRRLAVLATRRIVMSKITTEKLNLCYYMYRYLTITWPIALADREARKLNFLF